MTSPSPYQEQINATKRRALVAALKRYGTMRRAALALGISVATVSRDCRLLGIKIQTTRTVEVA